MNLYPAVIATALMLASLFLVIVFILYRANRNNVHRLIALHEECDLLHRQVSTGNTARQQQQADNDALFAKFMELRYGCQFYAHDTTWRPNLTKRHSLAYRDRGEVARVALAGGPVEPVVDRLHAEARAAEAAAHAAVEAEQEKIKAALAGVEETPA